MLGTIWRINTYSIIPDQVEEHEKLSQQLLNRYKQISPDKKFRMFRQRFHAPTGRITVTDGFESIADWEAWLDRCHQDEEYMRIVKDWYLTINRDSFRCVFWDERLFK
jgi:hypothetical protein